MCYTHKEKKMLIRLCCVTLSNYFMMKEIRANIINHITGSNKSYIHIFIYSTRMMNHVEVLMQTMKGIRSALFREPNISVGGGRFGPLLSSKCNLMYFLRVSSKLQICSCLVGHI